MWPNEYRVKFVPIEPPKSNWLITGPKNNWVYENMTKAEVETEVKNLARNSPEETFVLYELNRVCSAKVTSEPKLIY